MTSWQIKSLQQGLNLFARRYLKGLNDIMVDGDLGLSTRGRIRTVKYYLGYEGKLNSTPNHAFRQRLWHPKDTKYSTASRIARGSARRIKQRRAASKHVRKARKTSGVGVFDGVPVANWLVPYLVWARAHGWRGRLVSGWRNPVYSESLCYRICGAPRCPGRCAGKISNHGESVRPKGALDVSDYVKFGQLMRQCPIEPKLINVLGARDPVHFSMSGQ